VTKLVRKMYLFSFKFAKHVFFQNNDDAKLFVDQKIVASNKVSVLPGSGIPLDKITFSSRQYTNEHRKFFMPSRLLIDKGVGEYVEVCRQLKLEYGDKVEFYLAGKAEENPKLGFGIRTARSWNKDGFLNYIGRIDNSLEWMRNSDVVVLPSYREGTPRSLLEAASLGRPIVTTNAPGCKEVVIDQQNGLLCEAKNTKSLYNCIKSMIDVDASSLEIMGEASRRLVENKFDEQIVINSYKKVLEKYS
jgi:glycosyltransferase involved in cell wall biosynthesis